MKSIRISFRLDPYQLARGLQTIRQLEPKYKLLSINDVVKTIYHDYIAKMSLNKNENIPLELITEIVNFQNKPSPSKNLSLDDLLELPNQATNEISETVAAPDFEPEQSTDPIEKELTDEILNEINRVSINSVASQASQFDDPNQTKSDISSVTDFTPPKEWKE